MFFLTYPVQIVTSDCSSGTAPTSSASSSDISPSSSVFISSQSRQKRRSRDECSSPVLSSSSSSPLNLALIKAPTVGLTSSFSIIKSSLTQDSNQALSKSTNSEGIVSTSSSLALMTDSSSVSTVNDSSSKRQDPTTKSINSMPSSSISGIEPVLRIVLPPSSGQTNLLPTASAISTSTASLKTIVSSSETTIITTTAIPFFVTSNCINSSISCAPNTSRPLEPIRLSRPLPVIRALPARSMSFSSQLISHASARNSGFTSLPSASAGILLTNTATGRFLPVTTARYRLIEPTRLIRPASKGQDLTALSVTGQIRLCFSVHKLMGFLT
ncbi:unnamed protein product [Protopolystoma xenopodis]|uniref:Uncharacterized protein n=1 Tax=Protopolystoma xenopodis TaxID=117903 RepID=A0A3S5CL41_9PLAT|nr:unnamed protein product [Protopolystoma xenopodis]